MNVELLKALLELDTPAKPESSIEREEIVIGQRGWVWKGTVTEVGDNIVIRNAVNIRKWGTTKGLGQLAISGPTGKTILDPTGTIEIHKLAVVGRIICTGWSA